MNFKIGVAVIIKKADKILIGKRVGSHGAYTWCFPGGHVDPEESPEKAAVREVREETGLEVQLLKPLGFTFDHFEEARADYLTLFYSCDWSGGTPQVMETEKCMEWRWSPWEDLPRPLFKPIETLLATIVRPVVPPMGDL